MSVTGPFNKVTRYLGYYKSQDWFRQSKPRLDPLPYTMYTCVSTPADNSASGIAACWNDNPSKDYALNLAYEKFKSNLSEKSEFAVNLAERRQAFDMIALRSLQIVRTIKQLKQLRFHEAMNTLGFVEVVAGPKTRKINDKQYSRKGLVVRPKFKRKIKDYAGNFLEVHFGWEPLIKDIGAAVNTLQKGVPAATVHGSGRSNATLDMNYPPSPDSMGQRRIYTTNVHIKAEISVADPNLWLANQLGFVNPVGVVWELVPFSFVVDWFTNVGSFLGQYSDLLGLNVVRAHTSSLVTMKSTLYYNYPPGWWEPNPGVREIARYDNVLLKRELGISKPPLLIKPFRGLSPTRGITAIALLLQTMK